MQEKENTFFLAFSADFPKIVPTLEHSNETKSLSNKGDKSFRISISFWLDTSKMNWKMSTLLF